MERSLFHFKQFTVRDARSAMPLSTDAVLLGAFADFSNARKILDIGTGCGILALMAAQKSNALITAIEPDPGSVADARYNFESSPWNHRLVPVQTNLQDFSEANPGKFDHLVSNPPFFSRDLRSPDQKRNLARHDQHLTITELFAIAGKLLADSGKISLILPYSSKPNAHHLAAKHGFINTRLQIIVPRPNKVANRTAMEFQRTGTGSTREERLLIRDKDGNYTAEYKLFTKDFYLNF